MVCIAAFIVFAILGIFSVTYRKLTREAWICVVRRATLRPCETDFQTKVKGLIVGKLIGKSEKMAGFVSRHFKGLAWIIVILSISSTVYLGYGVYNLVRYQTCDPWTNNCPIGAKACPVKDAGSFWAGLQRLFGVKGSFENDEQVSGPVYKDKIAVVEFADYRCPACAYQEKVLREFLVKHKDEVNFVFRNIVAHEGSLDASKAAEAARKQGKFLEMHHLIFERQAAWGSSGNFESVFEGYAKELGLDMIKFRADRDSEEVMNVIKNDMELARKLGVSGTPTIFISGKMFYGFSELEDLEKALQEAK